MRLLVFSLVAAVVAGCGINAIPTKEEAVKAGWAEVQNQYQRRADVVPNLVEVVKKYAAHERDTLQAVTDARTKATQVVIDARQLGNAEAVKAYETNQQALSGALGRLLAVAENYPNLKADQAFTTLMAQLEGTENRIAVARRDYIAAVASYNVELKTIPGVWWKALLYRAAKEKETFAAPDATTTAPAVKL
jgi:LemA protein